MDYIQFLRGSKARKLSNDTPTKRSSVNCIVGDIEPYSYADVRNFWTVGMNVGPLLALLVSEFVKTHHYLKK